MMRMPLWVVPAIGLFASGCDAPRATFCDGVDAVIAAAKEPIPFESMSRDGPGDRVEPPAGLDAGAACTLHRPTTSAHVECLWVSPTLQRPAGSKPIAGSLSECLVPKGWTVVVEQGPGSLQLQVYTLRGEPAEVSLVSTGDGGLFRDSLTVRVFTAS